MRRLESDQFVGTWKLNVDKSKLHTPVQSQIMKVEETALHTYRFTSDIVTAKGKKQHADLTRIADGKEHRPEGVNANGIAAPSWYTETISPDFTKIVRKRDGRILGETDIQYSPDGKTQTTTQAGVVKGKPYKDVRVFERQ